MAEFQYYRGEEKVTSQQAVKAADPAPPPNALQFFDDETAPQQAWSNFADMAMEAGSVAMDIKTRLKETEDQNAANDFYVEYGDRMGALVDNMNRGNFERESQYKNLDLSSVDGVEAYYKNEEKRIYTDLAKTYNKPNYDRRHSLMKNRKGSIYINGLSTVRQNRVRLTTQKNSAAFDEYVKSKSGELTDKNYNYARRYYKGFKAARGTSGGMQQAAAGNLKKLREEHDSFFEQVKIKAKEDLQTGQINQEQYDNLIPKLKSYAQFESGRKLINTNPDEYLEIIKHPGLNDHLFGNLTGAQKISLELDASSKQQTNEKNAERKRQSRWSNRVKSTIVKYDYDNDTDNLEILVKELISGDTYKGLENRAELAQAATNLLQAQKKALEKPDMTKEALNSRVQSYLQSNLSPENMNPQPAMRIDASGIITDQTELRVHNDMMKYSSQIFHHYNLLKGGGNIAELENEILRLNPTEHTKGFSQASFARRQSLYRSVQGSVAQTKKMIQEDPKGYAEMVRGIPRENYTSGSDVRAWGEQFLARDANVESDVRTQMALQGQSNSSAPLNPNVLAQMKGVNLLNQDDLNGISPLLQWNNAEQNWPVVKEALKTKYPDNWPKAVAELRRKGILKDYIQLSPYLSKGGRGLIAETLVWMQKPKEKTTDTPMSQELAEAFNDRFGRGISSEAIRKSFSELFKNAYQAMAARGTPMNPKDLAERMFGSSGGQNDGIVLVDAPFHLSGHQQDKIWFPNQLLHDNDLSPDDVSKAIESYIVTNLGVDNDDVVFSTPMNSFTPTKDQLAMMNEEDLEKRKFLKDTVLKRFNTAIREEAGVIQNIDSPFISMDRNIDGESLTLVMKSYPFGGVLRVGPVDDNGNVNSPGISIEGPGGIIDMALRVKHRGSLESIANDAGGTTGYIIRSPNTFFQKIEKDKTAREWLDEYVVGKSTSVTQMVKRIKENLSDTELEHKGLKGRKIIEKKALSLKPNVKDLESISVMKWINNWRIDNIPSSIPFIGGANE